MRQLFAAGFSIAALIAPSALADAAPAALAAFSSGDYDAVVAAAAGAENADDLALAAKARNAQAIFAAPGARRDELVQDAAELAESALAAEPDHVEARLQLAIALWLRGRGMGAWESYRLGLPMRGRQLIEEAIAASPHEPWAHALLGAWHLEVARRGGRAGMAMMGARTSIGARAFNEAMRLDPDDAAISAQAAISYLALNPRRYEDEARQAIALALAAHADDAFEAAMQDEARRLEALLDAGDGPGVAAAVARIVDGA